MRTDERVERGLNQLGRDISTLVKNRKKVGEAIHNAVPQTPQVMTTFRFFDAMKIVAIVTALAICVTAGVKIMQYIWSMPI